MLENLDRLKVFYHIYSLKSIASASNTLHVTQSAVSQTLQKLEKEIQTPLFIRLHKKLVPTPAGDKLYSIVKSFMSDLDAYIKAVERTKEYPTGELRIGTPPELGKNYLSLIVAEFREEYPEVTFSIEFGKPEKLLPLLKEGKIDFVLLDEFLTRNPYIGSLESFHFEAVVEEKIILVCSLDYFENKLNRDLSFESLSVQNFISYRNDMQLIRQWFKKHFSRQHIHVRNVLTVDNHEAVKSAIMYNIGIGIVSEHLVRDELASGKLIHIETDEEDIINPISLVQLLDKIPSLTEKIFALFLLNKLRTRF